MAATYKHDYAAFGAAVLCAPFMVADMAARAEKVAAAARAISPVGNADPSKSGWYSGANAHAPGNYKGSFEVSSGVRATGRGKRRAYGRVTNTAGYAAAVEFGYGRVPKYRVLGKSLHAAG